MVEPTVEAVDTDARQAAALEAEMAWLRALLDARLKLHFGKAGGTQRPLLLPPPELDLQTFYGRYLTKLKLSKEERIVLCLTLCVHLRPQLLDIFFTRNGTFDRSFTEFGGNTDDKKRSFEPTVETALFLLSGESLELRLRYAKILEQDASLLRSGVLEVDDVQGAGLRFCGRLRVSEEAIDGLLWGRARRPSFGSGFPATRLRTELEFDDLVLEPGTLSQVLEIGTWLEHGPTLLGELGLGRIVKPGYRSLFCGPPGTGKTLTAALLGNLTGRPVYRVDLSLTVSKYIGETEKNLERVFAAAERQEWILFFDEADALFGKRSAVHDSHDRYANQEVSYLLQRVEDYPNVVILASNMKENLDDAFVRRFQSIIQFAMPGETERFRLWTAAFSPKTTLEPDVSLRRISEEYEISGGSITNVIRYATLQCLARNSRSIKNIDIINGIRREYRKEGRAL